MTERKVQIALKKGVNPTDLTKKQLDILEYLHSHANYDEQFDADYLSGIIGCHHSIAKQHVEGLEKLVKNIGIEEIKKGRGSEAIIKISKPKSIPQKYFMNFETKEEKIKGMVISEFPLDSVIGDSKQSREAKVGIIKYASSEKPDVIFIDGLVSRIRYPEAYIPGVIESNPLHSFMEKPFELASAFLSEIHIATPLSQIYVTMSDADESNMRRLTKYRALKKIEETEDKIRGYLKEIRKIKEEKERAEKESRLKPADEKLTDTRISMKEEMVSKLKRKLFMPTEESVEYQKIKQEVSKEYVEKLREKNPRVHFSLGDINMKMNGYNFSYSHNYNSRSGAVISSRFNKLEGIMKKAIMNKRKVPDFFVESGHHGEAVSKPLKHSEEEDKYTLMVSAPVMEDQRITQEIIDGEFMPEMIQGKQNKLEACKRTMNKNLPATGIVIFGKEEDGFFSWNYSLKHLAEVGTGAVKIEDMIYEDLYELSDIHIGKGSVEYELLKTALRKMYKETLEKIKKGKSAPLLNLTNESLQGMNYASMAAETKNKMPEEFEDEADDDIRKDEIRVRNETKEIMKKSKQEIIETMIEKMRKSSKNIVKKSTDEMNKRNIPRIMDQLYRYYRLTNDNVLLTLFYSKYDTAIIYNESTHIKNTVGEFGITETGLQTIVYKYLSPCLNFLEEMGEIKPNPKFKNLEKKIKICESGGSGYEKFPVKMGENLYKISATHKPGSANPSSNIPLKQIKRAINMGDGCDVFLSAHLHVPYFVVAGRQETNDNVVFYKGATFSGYDAYGKEGEWSPPVIGYVKGHIPTNKNGKGAYGVHFVTSDILKKIQSEEKA